MKEITTQIKIQHDGQIYWFNVEINYWDSENYEYAVGYNGQDIYNLLSTEVQDKLDAEVHNEVDDYVWPDACDVLKEARE